MIMTKNFVKILSDFKEHEFTLSGITNLVGKSIPLEIKRKKSKSTSYKLSNRFEASFDLLLNFSNKPIYVLFLLSGTASIITAILGIYMFVAKLLFNNMVYGYASIIVTISFIGSLLLLNLSYILLYLSKILIEVKNRPRTIIKRILQNEK
mgnify:CR=1 FL=1